MADKLASLFAKTDKKKQSKAKGGLSMFTNALSGETNFDAQTVKISMNTTAQAAPTAVADAPGAAVDIGRTDGSTLQEWSSTKSTIFTEKAEKPAQKAVFKARGKAAGVGSIIWQQLGAEEPKAPATAANEVSQKIAESPPIASDSPKKFVARGKAGATGSTAAPEAHTPFATHKRMEALSVTETPAEAENGLKKFVARGKTGATGAVASNAEKPPLVESSQPEAKPPAETPSTDGPKKFVARGKEGSNGTAAFEAPKPVQSEAAEAQPSAPAKPGRYVPPSRRAA